MAVLKKGETGQTSAKWDRCGKPGGNDAQQQENHRPMICDLCEILNHGLDLRDVWLRPCGWFSRSSQTAPQKAPTAGFGPLRIHGATFTGGGRERQESTRLMDAANMFGVGRKAPERGSEKSCLTSAAPPAVTAPQLPAPP